MTNKQQRSTGLDPLQGAPAFYVPPTESVKSGLGFYGWLGVAVVAGVVIWGATSLINSGQTGPSGASAASRGSSDPIEQARVVLGTGHSYEAIKELTDNALSSTSTPLTDENRSRAWSAVLKVADNLNLQPLDVMECVPPLGRAAGSAIDFPQAAGMCAAELAVE
jgi:hypothetical protein